MIQKSIPELQIELNDLKRKGCTPEELASWVNGLENPYEFRTNVVFFFMQESPLISFELVINRFSDIDCLWVTSSDHNTQYELLKLFAIEYASFIKDILGFTNLAVMKEYFRPNTNPYITSGNKLEDFYGEYLLA